MMKKGEERVVLVDEEDKKTGEAEKGAFLVFLFDPKGRLLLAKRSKKKMLWPDFWDASVASHPRPGESYKAAIRRRVKEEIGVEVNSFRRIGEFVYRAKDKNRGTEWEYCALFSGKIDGEIAPNPREISRVQWQEPEILKEAIKRTPESFTPWLALGLEKLYQ